MSGRGEDWMVEVKFELKCSATPEHSATKPEHLTNELIERLETYTRAELVRLSVTDFSSAKI